MSESREELIPRLKKISNEEVENENNEMSAMCYCQAPPPPPTLTFECEECNKEMEENSMREYEKSWIWGGVEGIRDLGYDAKIKVLCKECLIKEIKSGKYICNIDDFSNSEPLFCFYFRTNENEKYHLTESNRPLHYQSVWQFLNHERELIKRMTGLKLSE